MDTDSVSITGSLHEKNGKWQMVIYGKASVVYPEKDNLTPDKMVRTSRRYSMKRWFLSTFMVIQH